MFLVLFLDFSSLLIRLKRFSLSKIRRGMDYIYIFRIKKLVRTISYKIIIIEFNIFLIFLVERKY